MFTPCPEIEIKRKFLTEKAFSWTLFRKMKVDVIVANRSEVELILVLLQLA